MYFIFFFLEIFFFIVIVNIWIASEKESIFDKIGAYIGLFKISKYLMFEKDFYYLKVNDFISYFKILSSKTDLSFLSTYSAKQHITYWSRKFDSLFSRKSFKYS